MSWLIKWDSISISMIWGWLKPRLVCLLDILVVTGGHMGDSNPENMVCVLTCDLEIRLQFVQISHFQQLRTRPTNDDSHAIVNPHGPLIIVWQYCNNNAAT